MEQTRLPNTLPTSGENHAEVDHWLRSVRLGTILLFLDRNPIASSTLVKVGDRKLVLTCHHVWKIAPERIAIGQRDQPRRNVLLSDEGSDVVVVEVPAGAEFWFRDASGLELPCEFATIDIEQLRQVEVRGRPIAGHGYPMSHQHKEQRICGFSSYFGEECPPPEGYDIPDSCFCVRAEVTDRELAGDFSSKPLQRLNFKGMSGGPVYVLTGENEAKLCGLQSGQLEREVLTDSNIIWETVVRPDVLADCLSRALGV